MLAGGEVAISGTLGTMLRPATALLLLALPAAAGSISGQVIDKATGGAISGMEVRLWSPVYVTDANGTRIKSWIISATTTTTPGYFFGGLSGPCLVDTLPGSAMAFEYTDRWYAPNEASDDFAGFIGGTQLDGGLDSGGINIYVLRGGGIDGIVHDQFGSLLPGVFLRAELTSDPRVHHNDISQGGSYHPEHPGEFYFRNLPALGSYQILTYWQPGTYETQLFGGIGVSSGSDTALGGPLTMAPLSTGSDPWNGSHAVTLTGATSHTQKFTSSGAFIAPLDGSDFDEFCFGAAAGDRFKLSAGADVIPGTSRASPFVDPILRFAGPGVPVAGFESYDDDSGGGLNALIADTGELPGGTYCARVSTFGDTGFDGTMQGSTGRFVFEADRLNRRPLITSLTANGAAIPPGGLLMAEGDTVSFVVGFSDADGDPVTVTAVLVDAGANTVVSQTLPQAGATASFSWTLPAGGASADPYTVSFQVTDAPTDGEPPLSTPPKSVILNGLAPPQLVSPADGARLSTATPALEIQDLVDGNQTNVTYEFQLYDQTGALMTQSGSVAQDPSGHMTYFPPAIPENTLVSWRVRTVSGTSSPVHTAWTVFRQFLVDTMNEPPPDPVLVKPADGEEVMVRQPGLAAQSDPDPEGDAVSLVFQLASDSAFTQIVETSDPLGVTLANRTTPWTPSHPLAWGGSYWARVYAIDALGAQSGMSAPVAFTVRADALPATPSIGGPFAAQCQGLVLHDGPPAAIPLGNVEDPDGEPVTLELAVLDFASGTQLLDVTRPQSALGDSTAMDVSTVSWTEDAHYRIRARAGDGTLWTQWNECDFTLDQLTPLPDGGVAPSDGGTSGGGPQPPPDGSHRSGCSSTGASGLALLFGALALALRRRH